MMAAVSSWGFYGETSGACPPDLIIAGTASTSVLDLFLLFHYVPVQQAMLAWAKDTSRVNGYQPAAPMERFEGGCAITEWPCWRTVEIAVGELQEAVLQQVEGLYRFYQDNKSDGEGDHSLGVPDDFGHNGVAGVHFTN